jgi:hypothetical protein
LLGRTKIVRANLPTPWHVGWLGVDGFKENFPEIWENLDNRFFSVGMVISGLVYCDKSSHSIATVNSNHCFFGGRCYDHNFQRIFHIFGEKMAFFS